MNSRCHHHHLSVHYIIVYGHSVCTLNFAQPGSYDFRAQIQNERDTTRTIVVIQVKHFLNELMVEIYSKSPVRATGKVLLVKFS